MQVNLPVNAVVASALIVRVTLSMKTLIKTIRAATVSITETLTALRLTNLNESLKFKKMERVIRKLCF